jgi:glutamate/tyrosine decarboxylase-like PLP-dependent enzyme
VTAEQEQYNNITERRSLSNTPQDCQATMDRPVDDLYSQTHSWLLSLVSKTAPSILPTEGNIARAVSSMTPHLRNDGIGTARTIEHLMDDIVPALNASSLSPNYYGFVTGGATPAACIADQIVSIYDQNVQVHLPKETAATAIEDRALKLLLELLNLDPARWTGRTFTTGATASNVLGLACGRDQVVQAALQKRGVPSTNVANSGLVAACLEAGIRKIQILTTMPHSSLGKASSIVGLGRAAVEALPLSDEQPWKFDLQKLEEKLKAPDTASIVVISCGEVNTGRFATESLQEFKHIRTLCDQNGAWTHVDGGKSLTVL